MTKHMIPVRIAVFLSAILVLFLTFALPLSMAFAHDGEDHSTEAEAEAHEADDDDKKEKYVMSEAEMAQVIALLKQVIALILEQKRVAALPIVATAEKAEMDYHHDEHEDEGEAHEDEKQEETATPAEEKKLIIEVEEHFGKTHVHIRYTDKPEDMYFADAALSDEAGLITSIKTRSGLSEEVIKAALKYL